MPKDAKTLLAALRQDDGPLDDLVALGVDALLELPIHELVEVEWVVRAVDAALDEQVTAAAISRTLQPAAARERARARQSGEPVSTAVPDDLAPVISGLMRRPFPINPKILQDLAEQGAVRSMLGAVLQEALLGFMQRTGKLPGLSGAADLMGALGRRAGKGLFGAAGKGLERGMEQRIKEFLDQSMARLTGKIVELASSEGGLKLQGVMRADLFDKALGSEVTFYYEELAKLPTEEIWELAPALIAHNLARPELREALRGELRAGLERDGDTPLGEFLEELGAKDEVRALALERAAPAARRIAGSDAFAAWLEKLL